MFTSYRCFALLAICLLSHPLHAQVWERDTRFAPAVQSEVFALLTDGKVLVRGTREIVRLNADGTRDPTFSSPLDGRESVAQLAQLPGGQLIATGTFVASSGVLSGGILRLDSTGNRIAAAASSVVPSISEISVGIDGSAYGRASDSAMSVVRLASSGSMDASFRSARLANVPGILAPLAGGSVLVGTKILSLGQTTRTPRLVRLFADGSVDLSFVPDPLHFPFFEFVAIVPLPDGRAFVFGREGPSSVPALPDTVSTLRLLRIDRQGRVDFAHYVSAARDELLVAGVLFDLLRDSGASVAAALSGEMYAGTSSPWRPRFAVDPAGRLLLWREGEGLVRYTRSARSGASFDPVATIVAQPLITRQTVPLEGFFTLSATPGGLFPLTYQWRLNGTPVAGATTASFQLRSPPASASGDYTLLVSNASGSAASNAIRLTVDATGRYPGVTRLPSPVTAVVGETAVFSVEASGTPEPRVRWTFNGATIPGAEGPTLTLDNVQFAQAGVYGVVVSTTSATFSGSFTGGEAPLTVVNPIKSVYAGKIGSDGDIVVGVRADRSAVLLATLPAARAVVVGRTTAFPGNGAFSFAGWQAVEGDSAATATARTITGTLGSATALSGRIAGLELPFTAELVSGAGSAAYYHLRTLAAANAEAHVLVAPDGRAFTVLQAAGLADGGVGRAEASGAISALGFSTVRFTAAVEAGSGSITASVGGGRLAGRVFAGLRDELPRTERLVNLAARGRVGLEADALIAGFVVGGTGTRSLLIRAVGPTLASFGVAGALADPMLTLRSADATATFTSSHASSDDWCLESGAASLALTATRVGAFLLPNSHDAVVNPSVSGGGFTVQVDVANGGPGIGLAEIYDAGRGPVTTSTQKLINLSARARVGAAEAALIAGFVVTGNAPKRLLIRAVGPALEGFGVKDALADPLLTLVSDGAVLATNDDWSAAAVAAAEVTTATTLVSGFPLPPGSRDACLLVTLSPGTYTAQIEAKGGATGVALAEVYEVPW